MQLPWAFRRLRVLRRQLVPRHSPCTLDSLILKLLGSRLSSDRVLDALSQKTTMRLSKIQAETQQETCGKQKLYPQTTTLSTTCDPFQGTGTSISLAPLNHSVTLAAVGQGRTAASAASGPGSRHHPLLKGRVTGVAPKTAQTRSIWDPAVTIQGCRTTRPSSFAQTS